MESSQRFELRAYEATGACRLASVLWELMTGERARFSRDEVVARWAERYPGQVGLTGKRSIRTRIGRVLATLKVAGMVRVEGGDIIVINPDHLAIAARNLTIVEDDKGVAIESAGWSRCPEVPRHLLALQMSLGASRQAAPAEGS